MGTEYFTLFGTLATAIITVGGVWLKEALQRRSREQVRQRFLSQVKEEIAMIEAWAKAHASLGSTADPPASVRERAQRDLDVAYNRMMQLAPELREPITLAAVFSRLFLRRIHLTLTVRLLRVIYYLTLGMLIVWGLAGFFQPTSWNSPSAAFGTVGAYLTVAVAPAWFFGWITTYVARRSAGVRPLPQQRDQDVALHPAQEGAPSSTGPERHASHATGRVDAESRPSGIPDARPQPGAGPSRVE